MSNTKVKRAFYNNVWVQLATGYLLLSPIGSCIYDHTKSYSFFNPILKAFSFVWNDVLNYKISIWLILVISLITYIMRTFLPISKQDQKEVGLTLPQWLNYKKDTFKSWTWIWKYKLNYLNKYEVTDLTPLCNRCDYKMRGQESRQVMNIYSCPNCGNRYNSYSYWEYTGDIEALIVHNIENDLL